jgi:uncharacterized membrane protein
MVRFTIEQGTTEHIKLNGRRVRNPTVLLKVGRVGISRKAATLGALLLVLQILDGLLTFAGLSIFGIEMEGNALLRDLAHAYGAAPALFFVKLVAIVFVLFLTINAHKRRYLRPLIALLVVIYLALAIIPWVYILSDYFARSQSSGLP